MKEMVDSLNHYVDKKEGTVVVIEGDPGIGKSHFLNWFIVTATKPMCLCYSAVIGTFDKYNAKKKKKKKKTNKKKATEKCQ
jgi:hypothetical protein